MTEKIYRESNHPALYYQDMLADRIRMQRYRQAIERAVRPGAIVADLGTGLGVLAIMAARAGAAKVYAIDNRPQVIPLARRVVEANGVADRVEVIEADAREADLDIEVDLIVNELIGDFGTDENIHESVSAFARRHLAEGGTILPSRLTTYMMPVQYGDEFRGIWRDAYAGLDLRPAVQLPFAPEALLARLAQEPTALAEPQIVEDLSFSADMGLRRHEIDLRFEITRPGVLQGFMGFFESTLVPGVTLANHPAYPGCHWHTWHWPVTPPQETGPGQGIAAVLDARPQMVAGGWTLSWALESPP